MDMTKHHRNHRTQPKPAMEKENSRMGAEAANKRSGRESAEPFILLFDGECVLCNRVVRFVVKRDPRGIFRFASLQSPAGRRLAARCGMPEDLDSFVLVEGECGYAKSEAALRVMLRLRGAWPLLYSLKAVPLRWRDAAYEAIAARRYRWFGHRPGGCPIPDPRVRSRLLDDEEEKEGAP